ncbi:MAG: arylamine N-acetyltransferase [bacterium]
MAINTDIDLVTAHYFNSVQEFNRKYSISIRKPSINLLKEILYYFSRIPYENMSKIIKRYKNFDDPLKIRFPDEVMEDHFKFNFGGTCFSVTFLLKTILTFHGFKGYIVMADMNWGKNVHCAFVVVHNSQSYLVDPGYLLNQPLYLSRGKPVITRTPFSGIKLKFDECNNSYILYTFNNKNIKWRYKFVNKPVSEKEFLEYWLSSFNWNSMNAICIATVIENKMIYIHRTFMRETTFYDKINHNLKGNLPETISNILKINHQKIEEAIEALEKNKMIKQEQEIWKP